MGRLGLHELTSRCIGYTASGAATALIRRVWNICKSQLSDLPLRTSRAYVSTIGGAMRFLDGAATTPEIRSLVDRSKNVRMAVAFWGEGAAKELGLTHKGRAATVICNLMTGGTNPEEIKRLKESKVNVRQCDTLHGKVYLFDDVLIVGSSNASGNGLALQGAELSGWHEANVLIEDAGIYRAASEWFDRLKPREIEGADLVRAQAAFERRRRAMPGNWPGSEPTVVEALKSNPASFRDKRIYVCAYKEDLNRGQKALIRDEQEKTGRPSVSGFGWAVPSDSTLICFWIGVRGGITFDGFWETSHKPHSRGAGNSEVWFAESVNNVNGLSRHGSSTGWKDALQQWDEDIDIANSTEPHIKLEIFAQQYLNT
jgi:PLD-like domain